MFHLILPHFMISLNGVQLKGCHQHHRTTSVSSSFILSQAFHPHHPCAATRAYQYGAVILSPRGCAKSAMHELKLQEPLNLTYLHLTCDKLPAFFFAHFLPNFSQSSIFFSTVLSCIRFMHLKKTEGWLRNFLPAKSYLTCH